ncbi:MAG TPA: isochorismatase family cysteine hydrolase [Trebonia sp.]|nr:isochorismatase family cysteine hydrolase [Trebonia sp.]
MFGRLLVSLLRGDTRQTAGEEPVTTATAIQMEHQKMPLSILDPTPALVVIDLQKGIVADPIAHVVPGAVALAKAFRERGLPVVLVNVTASAPGRTDANRGGSGARAFPPGWADIIDELDQQPGDYLITKRRRSAFHDTGLDTLLRDLGVTQVVLTGVSSSSGVESTARYAYDYGYHVVFATDAIADPDPDLHRHCTERAYPKIGETTTSAEILDFLARRA